MRRPGVNSRPVPARAAILALICVLVVALAAGCQRPTASDAGSPVLSPTPRALSAEDQRDIDAQLASYAERIGLSNPPKVALIRIVPVSEVTQAMIACLNAAGFPATVTEDGEGWLATYSGQQRDAFHLASYTCTAQYPANPAQADSRMTRDQKLIVYHYLTVTLVNCLESHDHTATGIPTEQVFLDTWGTARWNPYLQFPAGVMNSLQKECEPNTPPQLIWGQ